WRCCRYSCICDDPSLSSPVFGSGVSATNKNTTEITRYAANTANATRRTTRQPRLTPTHSVVSSNRGEYNASGGAKRMRRSVANWAFGSEVRFERDGICFLAGYRSSRPPSARKLIPGPREVVTIIHGDGYRCWFRFVVRTDRLGRTRRRSVGVWLAGVGIFAR